MQQQHDGNMEDPYVRRRPTTTQTVDTAGTFDSNYTDGYSDLPMSAGNVRHAGDLYSDDDDHFSSRPSSRGVDSLASSSRPGSRQSTSRPGSRQSASRPGSRQRPYSAVSFATSVDLQERERRERNRQRDMLDTPNTYDGMMMYADYNDDFENGEMSSRTASRGGIQSRGGFSTRSSTRPESGRSSLQTPGTPFAQMPPSTASTVSDRDRFVEEKYAREKNGMDFRSNVESSDTPKDPAGAEAKQDGTFSPQGDVQEHGHKEHHASFVDPSGHFVTDDFIEALLGFKAGDPSLKVQDPEDEDEDKGVDNHGKEESKMVESGFVSEESDGASKRNSPAKMAPLSSSPSSSSSSSSSRPSSPGTLLNPNTVRLRVDKLREDVAAKLAAEEAARAARESGAGPGGVALLRTNAELDGNLEKHFPGRDFLLAKVGVSVLIPSSFIILLFSV